MILTIIAIFATVYALFCADKKSMLIIAISYISGIIIYAVPMSLIGGATAKPTQVSISKGTISKNDLIAYIKKQTGWDIKEKTEESLIFYKKKSAFILNDWSEYNVTLSSDEKNNYKLIVPAHMVSKFSELKK